MMLNIQNLIDDAKCYDTIRALRWPDGVRCAHCHSAAVTKEGRDTTQPERQKYLCKDCGRWFDDLSETIFARHHQPLRTRVLCLYFMGLNLSNRQIGIQQFPPCTPGLDRDRRGRVWRTFRHSTPLAAGRRC